MLAAPAVVADMCVRDITYAYEFNPLTAVTHIDGYTCYMETRT